MKQLTLSKAYLNDNENISHDVYSGDICIGTIEYIESQYEGDLEAGWECNFAIGDKTYGFGNYATEEEAAEVLYAEFVKQLQQTLKKIEEK